MGDQKEMDGFYGPKGKKRYVPIPLSKSERKETLQRSHMRGYSIEKLSVKVAYVNSSATSF